MHDRIAKPANGSYGTIDGVEITEEVIERLVKHSEEGFPGARFRSPGRPARTEEQTRAVTVRLTDTELTHLMARAEHEDMSRSDAIRAAIAAWSNEAA